MAQFIPLSIQQGLWIFRNSPTEFRKWLYARVRSGNFETIRFLSRPNAWKNEMRRFYGSIRNQAFSRGTQEEYTRSQFSGEYLYASAGKHAYSVDRFIKAAEDAKKEAERIYGPLGKPFWKSRIMPNESTRVWQRGQGAGYRETRSPVGGYLGDKSIPSSPYNPIPYAPIDYPYVTPQSAAQRLTPVVGQTPKGQPVSNLKRKEAVRKIVDSAKRGGAVQDYLYYEVTGRGSPAQRSAFQKTNAFRLFDKITGLDQVSASEKSAILREAAIQSNLLSQGSEIKGNTDYLETPIPFGQFKKEVFLKTKTGIRKARKGEEYEESQRVRKLGDLPKSYLIDLSGIDDWLAEMAKQFTSYRIFWNSLQKARKQTWYRSAEEYHLGRAGGRYSPRDAEPFYNPYDPKTWDEKFRRKYRDEDMWMEGKGVDISGHLGQKISPFDDRSGVVQLQQRFFGFYHPGNLDLEGEHEMLQRGFASDLPEPLTDYRFRRKEQRYPKSYDPKHSQEARQSRMLSDFWNMIGAIPGEKMLGGTYLGQGRFSGLRGVYEGTVGGMKAFMGQTDDERQRRRMLSLRKTYREAFLQALREHVQPLGEAHMRSQEAFERLSMGMPTTYDPDTPFDPGMERDVQEFQGVREKKQGKGRRSFHLEAGETREIGGHMLMEAEELVDPDKRRDFAEYLTGEIAKTQQLWELESMMETVPQLDLMLEEHDDLKNMLSYQRNLLSGM